MKTLFSLIWGQCTEVLCSKIEAVPGFEDVSHEADSLKLLVQLKKESYNFQSQKNPVALLSSDVKAFIPQSFL